uniref:YkvA family protein n=1 Tax=Pararhizobium sp. IMCC3301 TaxID=3067904 RepID=UPI002741E917|nr:YkvA family protein [Pararhizobium sp. IMCC3301]
MLERLKAWARTIKTDVIALYIAVKDTRTPLLAKLIAVSVVGYALSPIDLIPDFIPVVGYLDDLLIVPLGIVLAVRLIPPELMSEFRTLAKQHEQLPASRTGAIVVIGIWVVGATVFGWWLFNRFAG